MAPRPTPRPTWPRSTVELAVVTSAALAVLAYALRRFAGVDDLPIVLGALVLASVVGWTQPAVRTPPRAHRVVPVVVTVRHHRRPG